MSDATNELRATIAQMRGLNNDLRSQLAKQAQQGSLVLAADAVLTNVAQILELLPVLTEPQAGALLAPTETRARVKGQVLVDLLAPYLDRCWATLESRVWFLHSICGEFGSRVLDRAIQAVNKARRSRGAVEVAVLEALLQVHQTQTEAAAKAGGPGVGEQMAVAGYEEAVDALLEATGGDPGQRVLGNFTLRDLTYLKEIKRDLRDRRPDLADPTRGNGQQYWGAVAVMLEQSRARGMGPITARNRWQIAAERAQQPNVLFPPLNGRGGPKWGGIYENVMVPTTVQVLGDPVQGPKQLLGRSKVLTWLGNEELARYERETVAGKYPAPSPMDWGSPWAAARAAELEAKRVELLETDQGDLPMEQHVWRWDVTLEELGFEILEEEVLVPSPEKPWESVLGGGLTIAQVVEQLANFHRVRTGKEPEHPGGLLHQAP